MKRPAGVVGDERAGPDAADADGGGLVAALTEQLANDRTVSPHQISSASCSARPGRGCSNPCSARALATIVPSPSTRTAFVAEVPTSIPSTSEAMGGLELDAVDVEQRAHGPQLGAPIARDAVDVIRGVAAQERFGVGSSRANMCGHVRVVCSASASFSASS